MQRLFSIFPAGAAGFALLLVRAGIAALIASMVIFAGPGEIGWLWVLAVIAAFSLFLGALTPLSCLVAVALELRFFDGLSSMATAHQSFLVLMTVALGILGPGAFSLDARLFGRRVLVQ